MTPETFTRIQIEKYRHMSGEQRLLIGLKLHELSCEIARDGIRGRYPDADQVFVEEQLHQRLRMAYASQLGVEVIDNAYLDHWAKRIGVDDLLKHIREGNVPPKST